MNLINKHTSGKKCEEIACNYLIKNNFSIIKQNWRMGRYGEIDVIAKDNVKNELVFVEVKSRFTSIDEAKEQVTKNKQRQLYMLAKGYLQQNSMENNPCRFDVIAIKINNDGTKLEHIRNAF